MIALTLLACGAKLSTVSLDVSGHSVVAEVADSQEERALGLMNRDSLGADAGMIFIYPDTRVREFWMKDTRIPLAIAFLDDRGVIVRIAEMQPFDTKLTSSLYPARYALEMNAGWFAAHGVEKGEKVTGLPAPPPADHPAPVRSMMTPWMMSASGWVSDVNQLPHARVAAASNASRSSMRIASCIAWRSPSVAGPE